tara:strand:- start:3157 stop:3465 length:309 start_codon:yes stop_codon:yes gene_type:complete
MISDITLLSEKQVGGITGRKQRIRKVSLIINGQTTKILAADFGFRRIIDARYAYSVDKATTVAVAPSALGDAALLFDPDGGVASGSTIEDYDTLIISVRGVT